jgi:enamine deaminase RidA (YjgF/YER057c/UK114 family)
MTDAILARLEALNLSLPDAPAPVANYVPFLLTGDLLFVSGQVSKAPDGSMLSGKLGADLTVEQGAEAARYCALNILAQAHAALGRLDRVVQVMRLTGFVNSTPDFTDHPQVINGASDLMVDVLGDAGRHTRAAVGVSGLPAGCAVEVDAILKVSAT